MEQQISKKPHPGPGLDYQMFRTWFASLLFELLRGIALITILAWLLSSDLTRSTRPTNGSQQVETGKFPKK